mgnify:CR=1 FL=1
MLNVRKNAYKNESMVDAYWRLKRQYDDRVVANLFICFSIVLSAFVASVLAVAHF